MTTIGRAVRLRISVVVALLLAIVLAVLPPVPGTGLVAFAEETPPPENPLVVDPLLVGLEASSPEFQAGGSATLTATSSVPVEQIGATIELLDTADGSVVKSCASGTTCVATVSFLTGGPREYVAVVQDVESAPVTVARAAWTVELTTTLDVFGAGQQYKLTAEVNQEVRYTDGAYAVHIVDVTSGEVVKTCTVGSYQGGGRDRCAVTTAFYTGDPHQYVAYVSATEDYESDVQAQSAPVTVARAPWTVSLTSSVDVFSAGSQFELAALVNQEVRYTDGAYAVHIVDVTSGEVVKTCIDGTYQGGGRPNRCAVTTAFYTGDPHQYVAYVSATEDYESDVQAQSAPVTVARTPWTVSLTSSVDVFSAGSRFELAALVNQEVRYTDGAYAVHIVDVTSGEVVKTCTVGSYQGGGRDRCAVTAAFYTGDPHQYVAYVSATEDY